MKSKKILKILKKKHAFLEGYITLTNTFIDLF